MLVEWAEQTSSLAAGFSSLLGAGKLLDCTLAAEGRFLRAHKAVLAAASSYFEVSLKRFLCVLHNAKYLPFIYGQDVRQQVMVRVHFISLMYFCGAGPLCAAVRRAGRNIPGRGRSAVTGPQQHILPNRPTQSRIPPNCWTIQFGVISHKTKNKWHSSTARQ